MTFPALDGLRAALDALRAVPRTGYAEASDSDLVAVTHLIGELTALGDAHGALAAGVIGERSRPELGAAGLARREGFRTPEELLTATMKTTGRDAATAVRIGRVTRDEGVLAGLASDVVDGSLSTAAVDAIAGGLGEAAGVDPTLFGAAVDALREAAEQLDPDRLRKRAREVRDEIDAAGVADREAVLRSRRSLQRIDLRDSMKRLIWTYDPETAGIVDEIYDRATSPRRGGPRFVDPEQVERASRLADDPRTTVQIASDAFAELLRQAASADPEVLVGAGAPGVQIVVRHETLESGRGYGVIEARARASRCRPSSASRAATGSSRSCSTRRVRCSVSVGRDGCSRPGSVWRSRFGMAGASGPGASDHPCGAKRITSTTGVEADTPTSIAGCCCVAIIICDCTTRHGRSRCGQGDSGWCRRRGRGSWERCWRRSRGSCVKW